MSPFFYKKKSFSFSRGCKRSNMPLSYPGDVFSVNEDENDAPLNLPIPTYEALQAPSVTTVDPVKKNALSNDDSKMKVEWDIESLSDAKEVWPTFPTNEHFEAAAEECGGSGDCFFHCVAVGLFRASEFSRSRRLRKKYERGAVGMRNVRRDFSSMVTTTNAMGLAESLIDGALSDNNDVPWLDKLKRSVHNVKIARLKEPAVRDLQQCLREMICTSGTYFQGTDLLLRHYVMYVSEFKESSPSSDCATIVSMDSWTVNTLPNVGFMVMIDAFPGICELIGGRDKRFYIVLVNYGNTHWRLGYIRTREDKLDDPESPFCCVIEREVALRVLDLSDKARREALKMSR